MQRAAPGAWCGWQVSDGPSEAGLGLGSLAGLAEPLQALHIHKRCAPDLVKGIKMIPACPLFRQGN